MSANFVEAMEELEAENERLKALVAEMVEELEAATRVVVTQSTMLGLNIDQLPAINDIRALITRAKEAVS